jgi:hypothetical protein
MTTSRREFIGSAAGSFLVGGAAFSSAEFAGSSEPQGAAAKQWDLSWVKKITGKHKVVLDVPEVDSAFGVWRASFWLQQYSDVLGVPPRDSSSVLVMRHNGIVLAMQQPFWDQYEIGKAKNVIHPVTQKPTNRNPALLSSKRPDDELPPMFDDFALDKFIARGGVALGCSLALDVCSQMIAKKDKISEDAARKRAESFLVPGVVIQPSGIFAVIRAQEAGCVYVRAS